jgi:FkbM family methyltransferase
MKNFLGKFIRRYLDISEKCFSQNGEDLVLNRYFQGKRNGFYVDVGAHHPTRFSNTYLFYKRGWSGINIDANPSSMNLFNSRRKRDINLELGVSTQSGSLSFYQFNEPALNTFNEQEALLKQVDPYKIINVDSIQVSTLSDILHKHLPSGKLIDFLTIDVEGFEYEVLMSNDWEIFRPEYILVEILRVDLLDIASIDSVRYLCAQGYTPICKVYDTLFFKNSRI